MSEVEFDEHASTIASGIPTLPAADRIAAACRGSGNPVALSWLAECLALHEGSNVLDIGAGLGGPAAWLAMRYGCWTANLEPAANAAVAAVQLFAMPMVCGSAEDLPMRNDAFDAALLLGVLSVVGDPGAVLSQARRVADAIGVMEYCAATGTDEDIGGSRFPTATTLHTWVEAAGWRVVQSAPVTIPPPDAWSHATDPLGVDSPESESEVVAAIDAGILTPLVLHAVR
ncbi:MAG: Methyltransferase type 11, S-adenosyl-L-methionine-dependent [Acidimicrobiales bacterium]|nr:Methyltransferase type 11, S-adenosyl-L-methionine-dependent [Acidimicrobiales bacterium]